MPLDPALILSVLDQCSRSFTFPMLDNGYVYLSASRLSLHYSPKDWALVIEIFGFSPRAGIPDLHVHTFASRLQDRDPPESYVSPEAYANYLASHPNDDSRFFYPITEGAWMDEQAPEMVATAGFVELRGQRLPLPSFEQYPEHGINVECAQPAIHDLCRYLASVHRDAVLATSIERRVSVPPYLAEILVLEDWHHPNLVEREVPSQTATFRQLAQVLSIGDRALYTSPESPNTHWSHWPDGGTL